MEWIVQLQIPNSRIHQRLVDLFSFPDLSLEVDPDSGLVMRSSTFGALGFGDDAAESVEKQADELLKTVRGGIKVALGHSLEIRRGHSIRINDNGSRNVFVLIEECIPLVDEPVIVTTDQHGNEIRVSTPIDPVAEWFSLSLTNQHVRNALNRLAKAELDWGDLYAILDAVNADVANRVYDDSWATEQEVKLFKHTANNVQALGEEARHALPAWIPPADPMTYAAARTLIERIVVKWLAWRQLNP